MGKKKSKKRTFHYDDQGQFYWETYFVRGKQKRQKVRTIDGLDPDEYLRRNASDIWLLQEGRYDLLHERENERNRPKSIAPGEHGEIPF